MIGTIIILFVAYCLLCWIGMLIWLLASKESYFALWAIWFFAPIAVPFLLWEWLTD